MSEPDQDGPDRAVGRLDRALIGLTKALAAGTIAWALLWAVICLWTLLCLDALVHTRHAQYWLLAGAVCFLSLIGSLWVCRESLRLVRGTPRGPWPPVAACAALVALDVGVLATLGEVINWITVLCHVIPHALLAGLLLTPPVRRGLEPQDTT